MNSGRDRLVAALDRSDAGERALIESARRGDESAFRDLVEVHRAELHAHSYRMLGSVHDAEDALQDALLRAWRGLSSFEGRSSVRSWLYAIVTNATIDMAKHRSRRELPVSRGAAVDEPLWVEPYPDRALPIETETSPEARYDQHESLELAFIVAMQQLPPLQRAVLILREVVGFSAQEVASQLGTSVPAANSALQRARASTQSRIPARSQRATLRLLGDERIRTIVERYVDAIERGDTDMLVSMLTEEATWSMPPSPSWFQGREAITEFLTRDVFPERWRHRATHANGQLAVGCYIFDTKKDRHVAHVLDVLTLDGDRIAAVVGFITDEVLQDPSDRHFVGSEVFPHFGLPAEI